MANVDWALAASTTLTGIVVVFLVLMFLWLMVAVLGKVVSSISSKAVVETKVVKPVVATPKVALTQETVAAITGAVGSMVEGNFKITSIKLQGTSTNLWEG